MVTIELTAARLTQFQINFCSVYRITADLFPEKKKKKKELQLPELAKEQGQVYAHSKGPAGHGWTQLRSSIMLVGIKKFLFS